MAAEPATPIRKKRRRVQQKRRSDAGSIRFSARDSDIIRFGAEQTFARADTLGEYLAPGYTPATAEPPASQLADTTAPRKRAWPADSRHRQMAVSKQLRKLARRGYLEVIQPWSDQPPWYRATAQALRYLGLDWVEIPFPAEYDDLEARLRHDSQFRSHNHLINQVRLLLARRGAGAPKHTWRGERAIEAALPPRQKDVRRPHKADGVIRLEEDGVWEVLSADKTRVLDTVQMKAGQIIGIEVENTQKSDHQLSEILPDLVAHLDYVWYFCLTPTIRAAVVKARREVLSTDDERRRVRVLLLEDYMPCP
jgi:hypothetical protein